MPFEDFWAEATHAYVFFIMLSGMRGGRLVLVKLSLMMFPADTVKASDINQNRVHVERLRPCGNILNHPIINRNVVERLQF